MILVVDDEPAITIALAKKLRRDGHECLTASSGEEALGRVGAEELDLVITDVRMPGMSGIELLKQVKLHDSSIPVIVMSAYTDINFAIEALRSRADDFLLKPFNLDDFSLSVARSLGERSTPNGDLERLGLQAVAALASAAEVRDGHADAHLSDVVRYAVSTSAELDLGDEALRGVWLGSVLHEVGMLKVPEAVLSKPGSLSPEDWDLVRQHPDAGAGIVVGVEYLEPARTSILHHHERPDGGGYPSGLRGEKISIEGRIVAVASAFASMLDARPYRDALIESDAVAELERGSGSQFDESVVRAFMSARVGGFPVPPAYRIDDNQS
jgi:response regulator RpfG family c-di-GMP phosphodiesterase